MHLSPPFEDVATRQQYTRSATSARSCFSHLPGSVKEAVTGLDVFLLGREQMQRRECLLALGKVFLS